MGLSSTDTTHSTKMSWFSEETRYAMGNGEAWVDLGSPENLNGHRKLREGKVLSTSNTRKREFQNLQQHPKAKSKTKEIKAGAGLDQSIPDIAQGRREPRVKWIDPRNLVKRRRSEQKPSPVFRLSQVVDQSQEQRGNERVIRPTITQSCNPPVPGRCARSLKSPENDKDLFYPMHHETNVKQCAKVSNETAKQIADTYMWSGPIEGNGTQTHKKFGMCGLGWVDILDFLKAPAVGGKPTITITRITPGGSTSKVIIDDLMLQFSVPEADFLGNYKGGVIGVLGELGIQPVTYKTDYGNHLGRLLIDRTCLNGIFLFDYCGENLKDENRVSYDLAKQYIYLDSSSKWKWFLETFFTSDTPLGRKEPQTSKVSSRRKGDASPHVQLPRSVFFQESSIPVAEAEEREQEHMQKSSNSEYSDLLRSVLPSYLPRPDLPPGIGSLLIAVPLNGNRAICEMNRLNEIREQKISNPSNTFSGDQWRGKWLLLDAPITNMKWIRSAARNIYKVRSPTQQGGELTQTVAIDFSRKLWLDICEGMQLGWGKFPETEEVRAARIMKNRHGGQYRKEKQELSETDKALNSQHYQYFMMESAIENELREHGYRRRSEWDKLATGWVTEKLLDEPAVARLVEAKRKRMAMESELEEGEVKGNYVQARTDSKGEEETYLVISGCSLAKESSYNKFASSLATKQHITLSSSNLLKSSYPSYSCGQQRTNEAMINISCEEPIPTEVIHGKTWIKTQRSHILPTPWQDHGGVRELLGNDKDTKTVGQTYVVVLALIPSGEGKDPFEEKPRGQIQVDSQTSSCKRQSENQKPVDIGAGGASQGMPEKNAVYGDERIGPGQYELGLTIPQFELGGATSPFQLGYHIHPTSPLQLKSKLTNAPFTLASILDSGEYKVVAIYPQKKCCAYCGCIINTKANYDVICCGKSGRSSPKMSGKRMNFVHHTDEQAQQEGCSCNEAKDFHKANGCLSHCQYCNEKCKDKQCEEEIEMELVWSRMVDHFKQMDDGLEVGRRDGPSTVVDNTQLESNSITRWYRQAYSPQRKDTNMCFNWPGGWTERGVLTRKREVEERKAEIEREQKRSKVMGVEVGMPMKRIEYHTSMPREAPGWKGEIKEGLPLPWSRGSWGTESVWAGAVGGINGVKERLWGVRHA